MFHNNIYDNMNIFWIKFTVDFFLLLILIFYDIHIVFVLKNVQFQPNLFSLYNSIIIVFNNDINKKEASHFPLTICHFSFLYLFGV